MDSEGAIIQATPVLKGQRPKTYGPGRVCATDGCETVLSQYNKQNECYLHQPVKRPRLRGIMPSEVMEKKERHVSKCISCSQRKRYWDTEDKLNEVRIDGVRHYEGRRGAATLCEG